MHVSASRAERSRARDDPPAQLLAPLHTVPQRETSAQAAGAASPAGGSSTGGQNGSGPTAGAEPLPRLPQQPAAQQHRLQLMRRVEQAVTLFSLLLQLALYRRSALALTARQHAYQALLLALRAVCLWACTCLDLRRWLRYR